MDRHSLRDLRKRLRLSQAEFGQLLGAHAMTVSKWERGVLSPNAYQLALLERFDKALAGELSSSPVKRLLIGNGAPAALAWLLQAAHLPSTSCSE
jgi:transcriptional regulator with XRE-family HTH domain